VHRVEASRSGLPRRHIAELGEGEKSRASGDEAGEGGVPMSHPKHEKMHKLERQMADRMREHQDLMERFINTGDHSAQEKADKILHDFHRLRKERDELKERLNKPE
jgi:hypothetical protein